MQVKLISKRIPGSPVKYIREKEKAIIIVYDRMEFDVFVENVKMLVEKSAIERKMEVSVNVESVVKNNGCRLKCLTILAPGSNVSPSVYMERYYEEYNDGRRMKDIAEEIIDDYGDKSERINMDVGEFIDYNRVKGSLIMVLVNRELNSEMLENAPYIPFEDLAIVFRWMAVKTPEGMGTTLVTNRDIRRWGINIRELYDIASENTRRIFPEHVEELLSLLERKFGFEVEIEGTVNTDGYDPGKSMYIITNSHYTNGAAAMLYPGVLARCADMLGGDLYIIPSSVHEVLFVKVDDLITAEDIRESIVLANKNVVKSTEKLSDNLYIYRRRENKVEMLK